MKSILLVATLLAGAVPSTCSGDPGGSGGTGGSPSANYPPGSEGTGELRVRPTSEQAPATDIGAFPVPCDYSHMNTDDPIVYPNAPGLAHLHTFFGNTDTNAYSTHDSLRRSGNSTCRGGIANRTAYWVPSLLAEGSTPLAPKSAIFYYKSGYSIPNVSPLIQKIPAGLRMISGNMAATSPQTDGHAYWGCENEYKGHFPNVIDCSVGDNLQLTVVFPQCWNGRDLDSTDHKSHMAFPSGGRCPSSHPVILPEISLNVHWERTASLNVNRLRLSSDHYAAGSPGGYSAHGDWLEAWEPDVRDAFVLNCVNKTRDCHAHLLGDGRMIY